MTCRLGAAWLAIASLNACARTAAPLATRPILIQGALQLETRHLVETMKDVRIETVAEWTFWRGTLDDYPVVVSRTRVGTAYAAAATAIAIQRYDPVAIINQGTARGRDPAVRFGDIVIGTTAVGLAAFKTPARAAGGGSQTLDWKPLDLVERTGDADGALHEGQFLSIAANPVLLEAAQRAARMVRGRRIVEGTIGSSDVWNEEIDRLAQLRTRFGTSVEEMETAAAAQIAELYRIPFLGIRVVTANVTNGGKYDGKTADLCQGFVIDVVHQYMAILLHHQ